MDAPGRAFTQIEETGKTAPLAIDEAEAAIPSVMPWFTSKNLCRLRGGATYSKDCPRCLDRHIPRCNVATSRFSWPSKLWRTRFGHILSLRRQQGEPTASHSFKPDVHACLLQDFFIETKSQIWRWWGVWLLRFPIFLLHFFNQNNRAPVELQF